MNVVQAYGQKYCVIDKEENSRISKKRIFKFMAERDLRKQRKEKQHEKESV